MQSTIRKIIREDKSLTTNPKVIMDELKGFYSSLYQANSSRESEFLADSFLKNVSVPKLSEVQKGKYEENLTASECFNSLKSFQKNKTPGDDGLTVEFYLAFWPLPRKHLVNSFSYAHNYVYYVELSHSQKQAVIILVEKKEKTKG